MYTYIGKRLLLAIPTLIIISIFAFSLQKLLPGDPILAKGGPGHTDRAGISQGLGIGEKRDLKGARKLSQVRLCLHLSHT